VSGRTRASDLLGELLAQRVLLIDADRPQQGASHAIGFDTALAAQELEQRASGIVHPAARLLRCSERGCGAFPDAALSAAQKNVRSQPDDTGIQVPGLDKGGTLIRNCRHILLRTASVALIAPLSAWGGTGAPDTQLWTELDVTAPLATDITITGIARLRLSESLANPALASPGVDLNYKAGAWTLSAGYRYDAVAEREPETIDRKSVKITQTALLMGRRAWRFGRNTLAMRLRLDDTLNASSNPYRARIRLEYRWATAGVSWMSYLFTSDEVFYEFQDQDWFRNRFRAGANLVLSERTDLQVFYQRQDSNNSTPGAINALGLTLDVTFK